MRFRIGSTTYEAESVDRLSLANILRLETECASLGRPMKWSDVRSMLRNAEAMTAEELDEHDDAPWVIGLSIWASRLNAGENLTFEEAISFPLSDLEWIADPQDHQSAKDPRKPRPASGRGGKPARKKAARKTSATPSSPA